MRDDGAIDTTGFATKRIGGLTRARLLRFVPSWLAFVVLVTVAAWQPGRTRLVAMVGALAILAVEFLRYWWWTHRMRCPECAGMLRRETQSHGTKMTFPCPRCRIVWDTGFSEDHDAGGD